MHSAESIQVNMNSSILTIKNLLKSLITNIAKKKAAPSCMVSSPRIGTIRLVLLKNRLWEGIDDIRSCYFKLLEKQPCCNLHLRPSIHIRAMAARNCLQGIACLLIASKCILSGMDLRNDCLGRGRCFLGCITSVVVISPSRQFPLKVFQDIFSSC